MSQRLSRHVKRQCVRQPARFEKSVLSDLVALTRIDPGSRDIAPLMDRLERGLITLARPMMSSIQLPTEARSREALRQVLAQSLSEFVDSGGVWDAPIRDGGLRISMRS